MMGLPCHVLWGFVGLLFSSVGMSWKFIQTALPLELLMANFMDGGMRIHFFISLAICAFPRRKTTTPFPFIPAVWNNRVFFSSHVEGCIPTAALISPAISPLHAKRGDRKLHQQAGGQASSLFTPFHSIRGFAGGIKMNQIKICGVRNERRGNFTGEAASGIYTRSRC